MTTNQFPQWRGFHHTALVTPDLEDTINFYENVLGMRAGSIFPAKGTRGRHCFINPGIQLEAAWPKEEARAVLVGNNIKG